jgi:hypothetical protein
MFARIFIKEWRDNILLFILGLINLLGAFGLFLFRENKPGLYVSGLFLFFILPVISLLLGASAFQSELRNNAWTYVFSRPLAKPVYWLMKFVSQFSLVGALLALFFALRAAVPSSVPFLADLNFPTVFFHGAPALFIIPSLLAFTVAFCMSFLTDRPFVIFFLSLLIVGGLAYGVPRFQAMLWLTYFHGPGMPLLIGMAFASFIIASLIVFSRADLSQRPRAAGRLTILVVAFLALSSVVQFLIAAGGNPFRIQKDYVSELYVSPEGQVLLGTWKQGLMEYDPTTEKTRPISRFASTYGSPVSFAAGRAAFIEETEWSRTRIREDVRVIGLKDHAEIGKVQLYGPEAPLRGQLLISNVLLSPDGERIAIAGTPETAFPGRQGPVLYTMKPDGTRLTPRPLPLPAASKLKLLGWRPAEESLILLASDRLHPQRERLVKFSLETGTVQQTESTRSIEYLGISPTADYALYEIHGEGDKAPSEVVLMDLGTFQPKTLMSGSSLHARQPIWTSDGSELAFSSQQEVYRYPLPDGPLIMVPQTKDPKYVYTCTVGWTGPGREIAIFNFGRVPGERGYTVRDRSLKVYDADNRVIRTLPTHDLTFWNNIWTIGNRILVHDWREGLWRFDLKTEEWKRVY